MNEMQSMLADTAARLFEEQITPEVLARAEAGDPLEDLWTLVQQQGFDLALAPEEAGGSGLDWCTVYPLVLLSGKFSLPLPLAETLLATWLLGKAGLPVPQGRLTVARLGPRTFARPHRGGKRRYAAALPTCLGRPRQTISCCAQNLRARRMRGLLQRLTPPSTPG